MRAAGELSNGWHSTVIRAIPRSTRSIGLSAFPSLRPATTFSASLRTWRSTAGPLGRAPRLLNPTCIAPRRSSGSQSQVRWSSAPCRARRTYRVRTDQQRVSQGGGHPATRRIPRDEGDGCYRVEDGLLKASVGAPNGGERILAILGLGSVVGELSMIDGAPRSASITDLRESGPIQFHQSSVLHSE